MRILIITHYDFGIESGGGANRVLGLAKTLSNYSSIEILHRGQDMHIGSLKFIGYKSTFPFRRSSWFSSVASPYVSYAFLDFYRVLKKIMNDADIVQVEQPYMFIPALAVRRMLGSNSLMVLDEHNVDFAMVKSKIDRHLSSSLSPLLRLPYVFLSERLAIKRANLVLCVSHIDRNLLKRFYRIPENRIVVVPNGVSLAEFEKVTLAKDRIFENHNVILFHGTLSYFPNTRAANAIIDYVAPRIPEARFLIAGANPPTVIIKKLARVKNVEYKGFVENLEGWIKSSRICIAPMVSGGGTRLKVIEYAAAGKPIVATFRAVEGLGMSNGIHGLFYREVNDHFIQGIRQLMKDDRLAEKLGWNAKKLAKTYDLSAIGRKLYEEYQKQIASPRDS